MKEIDFVKLSKSRSLISDVFNKKGSVEIVGWVYNTRALGKIRFLILRDISGVIQITAVKDKVSEEIFRVMDSVSRESVIYVK